nr:hypothetical protein [Parabacteroides goldsteinii]
MTPDNLKNRSTLKEYFKKGKVPTEEQFADLIDAVSNIAEDGQVVRTSTGWVFFPEQGDSLNIGFYPKTPATSTEPPVWSVVVTPEKELLIKNEKDDTVIEITQDKTVTVHGDLKIEGSEKPPLPEDYISIPADKKWHDLPLDISREGFGCRVYRIYASFRERGTGLCRLTRLTALWLNFLEQRIESPQKHWWGWSGGVRFRWYEENDTPCLQMRSKKRLPGGEVHCRIVEMYKG